MEAPIPTRSRRISELWDHNTQIIAAQLSHSLIMDIPDAVTWWRWQWVVCKDLKSTSFGLQRGKNDGRSYQHVHAESVSCGTITPKSLLLNCPIHSLWIYQMMLHGGDGDGWSARISRMMLHGGDGDGWSAGISSRVQVLGRRGVKMMEDPTNVFTQNR
eukprot:scaffold11011_cov25-Cyclotella_meneghiniana.AAC.1